MTTIPKSVLTTRTSHKKVTHVLTVKGQEHYCTSATHVCETLQGAGYTTTPAVVYRLCSTSQKRAHKKGSPLPNNITVVRVSKEATPAPALAAVQ